MKRITKDWEYCECGCHGHEWSRYWLFNDLKGGFHLYEGHGWMSERLGLFKSFYMAEKFAIKHLAARHKKESE